MEITEKTIRFVTILTLCLSLAFIALTMVVFLNNDSDIQTDEITSTESTSPSVDSREPITSPPDTSAESSDNTEGSDITSAEPPSDVTVGASVTTETTREETTEEETTIEDTTVEDTTEESTIEETTIEETTVAETTVEASTEAETTEAETTEAETTAVETTVEITEDTTAPEETEPTETTTHTHSFSSWKINYMPTCEKDGSIVRNCSCGKTEYLPLPAGGHTEKELPAIKPTCTSNGKTSGSICSECNTVLVKQTTIPKLECKYENLICIYCGQIKDAPVSLSAPFAGLYKADTLQCLFSTAADTKTPPASLTKMITACVAIENLPLNTVITVGSELSLVPKYSSLCYIYKGNRIKLYDLLTGMLLCSGNDAAYSIAAYVGRHASGNQNLSDREAVDYFCKLMNDYAKELGAYNTNFTTPDGSDSENQYSTVNDLAIITAHAMKNKTIAEIVSTHYKKVVFASGQLAKWTNTNELINPESIYFTECVTGFKTGGTEAAGKCLSATFTVDGVEYIAIVMGCEDNDARYENIIELINSVK